MKLALITTTVNVPRVLALYRAHDASVPFFVAADHKTPDEAYAFCADLGDCEIYSPDRQKELGYESSELTGWNTDSRRNIALLEAVKSGADVIISVDDDMIPLDWRCMLQFSAPFIVDFNGMIIGRTNNWFNHGDFSEPRYVARGLPPIDFCAADLQFGTSRKIGVVQGTILGVPDADASWALNHKNLVHSVTDILRSGFVTHPKAHTVFNSQFTAFRRELAPGFAQFYEHQGRNTDIFASLLMQRVMEERGLHTFYGPPMGFHARTPRPAFNDLKAEMYGMEHIADFADYLRRAPLTGGSVVDDCRILFEGFRAFSDPAREVAQAFYNDCEKVL